MSKHFVLAMFMRHLNRSKQLAFSLQAFFHPTISQKCYSSAIFKKNANWRIAVDNITMTYIIFFQRKQQGSKPMHEVYGDHSVSVRASVVWPVLEFCAHGRLPAVVIYRGKIEQEQYIQQSPGMGTPAREVLQYRIEGAQDSIGRSSQDAVAGPSAVDGVSRHQV